MEPVDDPVSSELMTVKVDFEGLMEVVGKNLYSTPIVAIRELVQNAHDSCVRRQLAEGAGEDDDYAPQITLRQRAGILEIEDNGAGLTHQEIIDYLATIGAGYTRKLRDQHAEADLIGAFGLGFLSAYVLGERVEVLTASHSDPSQRWRFASHTGERYTLSPAPATGRVGTLVRLHLKEEHARLAEPDRLAQVLQTYCCLLPLPIELEGVGPINAEPPPWLEAPEALGPIALKKRRMAFASRFERRFEPLAALPIPPTGDGALRGGLLWIQDGGSYASSDQRCASVFVRGMLVTRDERDLLPSWAGFVGAVIDSRELTPTASREELIRDEVYERARAHLRQALIEGLERLAREEPAAWRRALRRHNFSLLGAAVSDPRLFALLADQLTVPTSEGDVRMPQLLERDRRIHISSYERRGPDEILFRAMQTPIVDGMLYAVYPFARMYAERRSVPLVELGTETGNAHLFPPVELDGPAQERLEALLGREGLGLVTTRFEPSSLPVVLAYDQEVKLKRRVEDDEADRRISTAVLGLARLYTGQIDDSQEATLYINCAAPIVGALLEPDRPLDAPGVQAAAGLLWSVAVLMAPSADTSSQLEPTLDALNDHLLVTLGAAPGTEETDDDHDDHDDEERG